MAKKRFSITPKLKDEKKPLKKLPVQNITVEDIEKIAGKKVSAPGKSKSTTTASSGKISQKRNKPVSKRPQGRPRRTEPVKRLSSDLPAALYEKVKNEVKSEGYTLNGFLAKVLREYFKEKG